MAKEEVSRDEAVLDAAQDETVLGEISERLGFRDALARRRWLNTGYRVGVGVLGTAIVVLGLALIPLPGPGWLIVFGGLAVLATEFVWAERLLTFARRKVHGWTSWVGRQSLPVRAAIGLGGLLFVAAAAWLYLEVAGLPEWLVDRVPAWVPGE